MLQKTRWIAALFLLAGCQAIGDFADNMGEHLPTIGDRCEHWQCITAEGQAESDAIKKAQAARQQQEQQAAQQQGVSGAADAASAPPPPSHP